MEISSDDFSCLELTIAMPGFSSSPSPQSYGNQQALYNDINSFFSIYSFRVLKNDQSFGENRLSLSNNSLLHPINSIYGVIVHFLLST